MNKRISKHVMMDVIELFQCCSHRYMFDLITKLPRKWRITSQVTNYLASDELPRKWRIISQMTNYLASDELPRKWRITSQMTNYLANDELPRNWRITSQMTNYKGTNVYILTLEYYNFKIWLPGWIRACMYIMNGIFSHLN